MFGCRARPRILIVTPEITHLPRGMGNLANQIKAKAGGLADVSAAFNHHVTASRYAELYERMLHRPLAPGMEKAAKGGPFRLVEKSLIRTQRKRRVQTQRAAAPA